MGVRYRRKSRTEKQKLSKNQQVWGETELLDW